MSMKCMLKVILCMLICEFFYNCVLNTVLPVAISPVYDDDYCLKL